MVSCVGFESAKYAAKMQSLSSDAGSGWLLLLAQNYRYLFLADRYDLVVDGASEVWR